MTKLAELLGGQAGHSARLLSDALTAVLAQMTEELVEAKNHVALARREERRVSKQAELAESMAEQWSQRATSAARAGDDVTATDALARKHDVRRNAASLRSACSDQRTEVARRTALLAEMSLRVEEAKRRKNAVLLRAASVHAEGQLVEEMGDPRRDAPLELLSRLESSLSRVEREAELLRELSDDAIAASARAATDAGRAEAELRGLKRLAKARPVPRAKKPLAKTSGSSGAVDRVRASVSRERRTKR